MADRLRTYRAKRRPGRTPEPAVDAAAPEPERAEQGSARFVVQEHHATRLHWDLRLERDGVLASWAIPNALPDHPRRNRMAVRTEDHPIEYLDFAGEIPEGEYGAGAMSVWDRGTYECEKWRDDELIVVFHGERLQGKYALFRTGSGDSDNWMIHRMDPPVDPTAEEPPERADLVQPSPGDLPPPRRRAAYAVEPWWRGVRVAIRSLPGRITFLAQGHKDVTVAWPELRRFNRALSSHDALLDGVIMVPGDDGLPSDELTDRRVATTSASTARRLSSAHPAVLVVVDLLHLDGHATTSLSYEERRGLLESLGLDGERWRLSTRSSGRDAAALLDGVGPLGLPGVICKPLRSTYDPAVAGWIAVSAGTKANASARGRGRGTRSGRATTSRGAST